MQAQQTNDPITGEYYLRGVMETASGFKLNPDSNFEFFFSYGALDRSGSGIWRREGHSVIFNSAPAPGQNFALTKSVATAEESTVIRIKDPNSIFLSSVFAIIKSADRQEEAMSNREGEIWFPKMPVDSITLYFEFSPERPSVFVPQNKSDNLFEFRFEPWVMEVYFNNFSLQLENNRLKGSHPLLKKGEYEFTRR